MRITSPSLPARQSGFALIMVMCFLAVSLTVFASVMYWISTNATITQRNNAYNQAAAAAESATESSLAYMMRDYTFQALNLTAGFYNSNSSPNQAGWPIGYQFNNISISISPTNWQPLSGSFAGLNGMVQNVTNIATAIATNGVVAVSATVEQDLQFASIPLFQYAIFYNMDLEICPGGPMTIKGSVHSNDNIWAVGNSSANPLTFGSDVTASGFYTNSRSLNDPQAWSPGNVIFTVTQNNPLSHVDPLTMPIGTNNNPAAVEAIMLIPPSSVIVPSAAAYSPTGQVYFYNEADLIITNSASNPTNYTVFYDNQYASPQLQPVLPDQQVVTNNSPHIPVTYFTNYIYSWITNASFYDYREGDTVQAIQINVSNLVAWLTNNIIYNGTNRGGYQYNTMNTTLSTSKGHGINSIYVYNSVPLTSTTLPAVRLVNGQRLPPAGLSVATPQPLYVMGNYNVETNIAGSPQALTLGSTTNGAALPAGFMADAITILSSSWSDSYNSGTSLTTTTGGGPRTPVNTTINAACLEGIVQSFTANGTKYYSGGVENFLRMLENWSSSTALTYNGSIIVLFPSIYATNVWQNPGVYYNPPNRQWGFDLNYLKGQGYQPPMSPSAKKIIRSAYSSW